MEEEVRKRPTRRVRRKPKVRWGRVILALVILIVLVGGIGFGLWRGYQAAVSYFGGSATTETTTTADVAPPSEPNQVSTIPLEQKSLDKPIYILLVGKDSNNPAQGDALFLLSVNEQQKNIVVIGIPSNTKIYSRDNKSVSMINTMYSSGNIELTKAVVEDLFHIPIPYYVVVDEAAFKDTLDVLGSQDMYVEKEMVHIDDATDTADVNLARGYQTLDADKAYQYVRFVDADKNAFSRTQRQERFLKQLLSSQEDTFTISRMWHVWRLWSHYDSNISTTDAVKLVMSLGSLTGNNIQYYILPGTREVLNGEIFWTYDPVEAQQLLGITLGNAPIEGGGDGTTDDSKNTSAGNAKEG